MKLNRSRNRYRDRNRIELERSITGKSIAIPIPDPEQEGLKTVPEGKPHILRLISDGHRLDVNEKED